MLAAFKRLDSSFNPCVPSSGSRFDKNAAYSCDANAQIIAKRSVEAQKATLVNAIALAEEAFLGGLSAQSGAASQDDGWQIASRTDLSLKDLKPSGSVPPRKFQVVFSLVGNRTVQLGETHYTVMDLALFGKAVIESLFGITYGSEPAPVLSHNNPRALPLPYDPTANGGATTASAAAPIPGPDGAVYYPYPSIDSNTLIKANWQLWKLDSTNNQWRLLSHPGLPPFRANAITGSKTSLALTEAVGRPACATLQHIPCLASSKRCAWQSLETRCVARAQSAPAAAPAAPLDADSRGGLALANSYDPNASQANLFTSDLSGLDDFRNWTAVGKNTDTPWNNMDYNCQGFANAFDNSALNTGAASDANIVDYKGYDAQGNQTVYHAISQVALGDGSKVLVDPATGNRSESGARSQ